MGHYRNQRLLKEQAERIKALQKEVDDLRSSIKELGKVQAEIEKNLQATNTVLERTGYAR